MLAEAKHVAEKIKYLKGQVIYIVTKIQLSQAFSETLLKGIKDHVTNLANKTVQISSLKQFPRSESFKITSF